jgi:hypothetical protein
MPEKRLEKTRESYESPRPVLCLHPFVHDRDGVKTCGKCGALVLPWPDDSKD